MRIVWRLEPRARAQAEARWTIAQLSPLLDAPWRLAEGSAPPSDGEVPVFVGALEHAPAHAAAVVALGDWPRWDPAALGVATFDRVPLPCPGGSCPPPADPRELPAAWLRALFFLMSREEERLDPRRDQWQCYSGFSSRMHELKLLGRALVEAHAAQLRARLDAWCAARGQTLERVPRWPGGAPFAATLSHDVDDVSLRSIPQALRLLAQARSVRSYALRGGLAALSRSLAGGGPDPYHAFDRWAAEESRRGFRSTFYFFPPSPARRHEYDPLYTLGDTLAFEGRRVTVAHLLRELHTRGFEIGLHGGYLSHVDGAALEKEKRQLEAGLGAPLGGVRQHYLRFDSERTWDAQEAAGFTCDATLGYNETPGFRAGIAAPFHPWSAARRGAHSILEVPLTCMDGALFRSLRLPPERAIAAVEEHLAEVESAGGLASLLWHPNAAAEELFPGWWKCWLAALDRLAARGAWVAPARDVERWWRERSRRLAGEAD